MVILVRRMLFPLIRRFWRLFVSMALVSCLGIALMTGLGSAYYSLQTGFDGYIEEYGYPDIIITVSGAPREICAELEGIDGAARADGRMAGDYKMDADGKALTARVFTFSPDSEQRFYVRQTSSAESGLPGILVEASFAEANGISAGSEIALKTDSGAVKLCVTDIVSTPEALSVEQNAYLWGSNPDFGYVYLPEGNMEEVFGSGAYYRQLLLYTEADADSAEVLDRAESVLKRYGVISAYTYEDSPVKSRIRVNTEPLEALSLLLPPLFFGVMLLVMLLFLLQIIQQCRKDIGILRTFGFGSGQISSLFFALCFCVTLPAAALGIGCGKCLMELAVRLYADSFVIPPVSGRLRPGICLAAALLTVLTGQLAAAIGCRRLIQIRPSEALKRKTVSDVSPAVLGRLPKGLPPLLKLSAAVALRNGKRFVLTVVCIAASTVLILSALSFERSKNFILEQMFEKRIGYDCQLYLDDYPDDELINNVLDVPGVSRCERLLYMQAEVGFCGKSEEVLLNAPEEASELVLIPDERFKETALPEEGIVLEMHLAKELGAEIGDEVFVNRHMLTVTGLSNQSVSRVQYVSQKTAEKLGESMYSVVCAGTDEKALREFAGKLDGCQTAVFTRLLREGRMKSFESYSIGVWIIICFAAAMGLMIVYNRMKSNITEQQSELTTLRILGAYRGEISGAWLLQSLTQFVLAALAGLPLGALAAKVILGQMSTSKREYPFANRPWEYLLASIILLLFILAGHVMSMAQLRKWNLAENSKTAE